MSVSSPNKWYVLYVQSRHEKKIDALLRENRIETFLPLVKTIRKWSDRKKEVEMPLFPSYIFVKINLKKDVDRVLSVRTPCSFIRFGSEFAKVQEHEINSIRHLMKMNVDMKVENLGMVPKVGEFKKIKQGVLDGMDCEIVKIENEDKIVVRIDSIRQSIVATVPSSDLVELVLA
ncbi:UpxY family transcription antiterminator [Aquimarina longa]|uniref:UpxY family transcription antiterminator n=1 Tax=Aquimarina longa TaxID=1080221 RepID=UPI000782FE54|nr:UpxY family transcription antiterminator [Aquimarina longa]